MIETLCFREMYQLVFKLSALFFFFHLRHTTIIQYRIQSLIGSYSIGPLEALVIYVLHHEYRFLMQNFIPALYIQARSTYITSFSNTSLDV